MFTAILLAMAQPPSIVPADPPTIVARVESLERRVASLETRSLPPGYIEPRPINVADAIPPKLLGYRMVNGERVPVYNYPADPYTLRTFAASGDCPDGRCPTVGGSSYRSSASGVVPPGMHAHRRVDGTTMVHGNENMGSASAHAGIARPWIRIAEVGEGIEGGSDGGCPSAGSAGVRSGLGSRIGNRGPLRLFGRVLLRGRR